MAPGDRSSAAWLLCWALAGCATSLPTWSGPSFSLDGAFVRPVPLVTNPEDDFDATVARGGGLLAYAARQAGNIDIYVRPHDGSPVRLTTHSTDDTSPVFSPDGRAIAWVSQADDVKGDIWVMDANGANPRRLTDRASADSAPVWHPSGRQLYYVRHEPGTALPSVHVVSLEGADERVVARAWDPAVSADGEVLVFVAPSAGGDPRLFALRLRDGQRAAVTDGEYPEGLPRVVRGPGAEIHVLFSRFTDDHNDDGVLDGNDPPSLWATSFVEEIFAGAAPRAPAPLTSGARSELLAVGQDGWLAYTAQSATDLDIYALPVTGRVAQVPAQVVLEAGTTVDDPSLRRLALRHVMATAPDLRDRARYELAREMVERRRYRAAAVELRKVAAGADDALAQLARMELVRLQALQALWPESLARVPRQREVVRGLLGELEKIPASQEALRLRKANVGAELRFALGERGSVLATWEALAAQDASVEDAARALWFLAGAYADIGELEAAERVVSRLASALPAERFYGRDAARRWISALLTAPGLSPAASMERLATTYAAAPPIAARALAALAKEQARQDQADLVLATLRRVVSEYPGERSVLSEALLDLAELAEAQRANELAIDAYERLLANFGAEPALRSRAVGGIARLALAKAYAEEARGELGLALESHARLLRTRPDLVEAHRRFIALSWQLGRGPGVLERYRAMARERPRDEVARYGHALALSYVQPLRVGQVEEELRAALDLNPRFAAARLTLGWLYIQREQREPLRWLERAEEMLSTAADLMDASADRELWASVQLNRGNVFFALDKIDFAFEAYLERELSGWPFTNAVTELVFRERMARAAFRMDQYDVALDMVHRASALAKDLGRREHQAANLALTAAIHSQIASRGDGAHAVASHRAAADLYAAAAAAYAAVGDGAQVVTMKRGEGLARRWLGQDAAALEALRDVVRLVSEGASRAPPSSPLLTLVNEQAADPLDVTRALYGFTGTQEVEIANAVSARVYLERRDLGAARAAQEPRLLLLRAARAALSDPTRLDFEMAHALYESAVLAHREGRHDLATRQLLESAQLSLACEQYGDVVTAIEAFDTVRRSVRQAPSEASEAIGALAQGVQEILHNNESASGRTLRARVTSLQAGWALEQALSPVALAAEAGLRERLAALEARGESLGRAERLAGQAGSKGLEEGLRALRQREEVGAVPTTWWGWYDRATRQPGELARAALANAVNTYLAAPRSTGRPEEAAFFARAVASAMGDGSAELILRLFEKRRLLRLQPSEDVGVTGWADLVAKRGTEAYPSALAQSSMRLRALEAQPATLDALITFLGSNRALLMQHRLEGAFHWFVVSRDGVVHVAAATPDLPTGIAERLRGAAGTVFVDMDAERLPGLDARTLVHVVSATYMLAAAEQRINAPGLTLSLGGPWTSQEITVVAPSAIGHGLLREYTSRRAVVHVRLPVRVASAWDEPPSVALLLGNGERTPLSEVMGLDMQSEVLVLEEMPASARRAAAHALLLAGVPSVFFPERPFTLEELRDLDAYVRRAPAHAWAGGVPGRWYGDTGMTLDERVDFALRELLGRAGSATKAFARAESTRAREDWLAARRQFLPVMETVRYLRAEPARSALTGLANPTAKVVAKQLPLLESRNLVTYGKIEAALGALPSALDLQRRAVQAYRELGDTGSVLDALTLLGEYHSRADQHAAAVTAYHDCMTAARSAGDTAREAECTRLEGKALRAAFDYEGAEAAYRRAIELYAAVGSAGEVEARRALGYLYESALNDYDRALTEFERARELCERLGLASVLPKVLLEIGRIYRQRGDYATALDYSHRAEDLLAGGAPRDRAEAVLESAKVHWYRGNYRRAKANQLEALDLARQGHNEFLEIQALSLGGLVALRQRDLRSAEGQIEDALALARRTSRLAEEAAQLNNLGLVLREAGRYDEAMARFLAALTIDERLGSAEGRAYDLRNVAVTELRRGNISAALGGLREALAVSRQIGNRYNELNSLYALGEAHDAGGDGAAAAEYYRRAAELARDLSVPEVEWRAWFGLGRRAEGARAAKGLYLRALAVAERMGRGREDGGAELTRDDLYAAAMRAAMDLHEAPLVFELAERARLRAGVDVLTTRTLPLPEGMSQSLMRESALRAARLAQEALPDEHLVDAKDQHEAALRQVRQRYPARAHFFLIHAPSAQEVQARLDDDTGLLAYFVGREALWAQLITARAVETRVIELPAHRLEELARAARRSLDAFAPMDDLLRQLADALVAPFSAQLVELGHVVVVPHGPLFGVPFAALPLGDATLLDAMTVSYAPSLAYLVSMLGVTPPPRPTRVAALAPASDLEFGRLEASAVAGPAALLGANATEAALRNLRADALDVVAHAVLDPQDPLGSAIDLAGSGGQVSTADGRVFLFELLSMSSLPSLVALSACRSAISSDSGEWLGLAGGTLLAGVRSVVATQSRVSDLASGILMKHFFRAARHRGRAAALGHAAKLVRARYAHPAHWASFVLVGDYR